MPASIDMSKKRKVSEKQTSDPSEKVAELKPIEEAAEESTKVEKPWEGKQEEEEDYRWNVCENC